MNNSKTRNIIIGILVVVVVAILIIFGRGNKKTAESPAPVVETPSETKPTPSSVVVPMPSTDSWTTKNIKGEISFEIPKDYYISYPRIDGCDSVASIGTQTKNAPVVSIMLVYKKGCVKNADVINGAVQTQEKNGYIFQTNSSNQSVLAIFNNIVASAK